MAKAFMKKGLTAAGCFLGIFLPIAAAFFLSELLGWLILKPGTGNSLLFGAMWALVLAGICLIFPRKIGRIVFGVLYYVSVLWGLAQCGYYMVFGRMMWLTDMFYASEGAPYLGDILAGYPLLWWLGGIALLALGGVLIWKFPRAVSGWYRIPCVVVAAAAVVMLFCLPEIVFLRDLDVWGTRSEYAQSSSYRATYNTMYDARKVYEICGVYQLTFRDVWVHGIYPLTPAYRAEVEAQSQEVDAYFENRPKASMNAMSGAYEGKNVVLVLMESMDDWMITPEDTPTLHKMMTESINFTDFYTPGYGTARTINSEFCMNTGIYLPTNGDYVFDYVTNDWSQSIASQMEANGYTSEVFHYNTPDFYSRGVFETAMGYNKYNCYADYETDKDKLYDDCLLFDIPELNDLFFREGQTFNTIITRSAHLSYIYNEVLSYWGLKQYPEYRGLYGSEEEDCARLKAKLVDDMFARLLEELEAHGQLENTVIVCMTDHYTYGFKNVEELMQLSQVEHQIMLERTPFFIWTKDGYDMDVDKTMNTADLVPTVLNIMGIHSPYRYLGQDAFDPYYQGYALFPDGTWMCDGVVCKVDARGESTVMINENNKNIDEKWLLEMQEKTQKFIRISNLLLTSDYYSRTPQ